MTILDLFGLDGKVAVVTGASAGLGAGFARALAEAGADVVLGARRAGRLEELADEIRSTGRRVVTLATDVTKPDDCTALVAAGISALGAVDVLVNNAGVAWPLGRSWEVDPDEWQRAVDVNLAGAFRCARLVLPGMLGRGYGRGRWVLRWVEDLIGELFAVRYGGAAGVWGLLRRIGSCHHRPGRRAAWRDE